MANSPHRGTKRPHSSLSSKCNNKHCSNRVSNDVVVNCSSCDQQFCYNIIEDPGRLGPRNKLTPCVTIPRDMTTSDKQPFRCPICLSRDPDARPDYIINNLEDFPDDVTTRMWILKSAVVIVFFYLETLQAKADTWIGLLRPRLENMGVCVITEMVELQEGIRPRNITRIREQLSTTLSFHLAVLFLTEPSLHGEWCTSSTGDKTNSEVLDEPTFLGLYTGGLAPLARDAITSRVFPIVSAARLTGRASFGTFFQAINSGPWHSIILPTTAMLDESIYFNLLDQWLPQIYYYTKPFKGSLISSWASSKEARGHTGFVVMERLDWHDQPLHVYKLDISPEYRPFGVQLPAVPKSSTCTRPMHRWGQRYKSRAFGEQFFVFASENCSGCKYLLYLAIYPDRKTETFEHKIHITAEAWDSSTQRFTFDRERMVQIKIIPKYTGQDQQGSRLEHEEPWTIAGRDEYQSRLQEGQNI